MGRRRAWMTQLSQITCSIGRGRRFPAAPVRLARGASDRRLGALPRDEKLVRDWLTAHSDVQKAIVATGAAHCAGSPDFRRCMRPVVRRLFRAGWPADYADWCLEQATAATDHEVAGYFRIAFVPTPEATDALAALRDDHALRSWRPALVDAADRQGAVRRDAEFRHPGAARRRVVLAQGRRLAVRSVGQSTR